MVCQTIGKKVKLYAVFNEGNHLKNLVGFLQTLYNAVPNRIGNMENITTFKIFKKHLMESVCSVDKFINQK